MLTTKFVTTATPWGEADTVTRYAVGVNLYSTPGHGGFKLSGGLNALIPEFIRQESFGSLGLTGWYEEDEDANIVVVAFGHLFPEEQRKHALAYLTLWHPAWADALVVVATETKHIF